MPSKDFVRKKNWGLETATTGRRSRQWRALDGLPGVDKERIAFEAGELRTQAFGVVVLFDVDDFFRSGYDVEGDVAIVAALQINQPAADALKEQVEREIAVGHGRDGVDGVGIAAAN